MGYYRGDYYRGDYYRGDLGGFFKKAAGVIGGAVKGFVTGGPLGAVGGAVGALTKRSNASLVPQVALPQSQASRRADVLWHECRLNRAATGAAHRQLDFRADIRAQSRIRDPGGEWRRQRGHHRRVVLARKANRVCRAAELLMAALFAGLHPQLVPYAEWIYYAMRQVDPTTRITSVRRSSTEQARLYRRYLAGQSRFPAAPPGRSKHEQGLAFDIVARDETLAAAGALWERIGGRWGGRFNDPIHFEV